MVPMLKRDFHETSAPLQSAKYLSKVTFINTTNLFTLMLCPVYVTSFTRYYCILTLYVPLTWRLHATYMILQGKGICIWNTTAGQEHVSVSSMEDEDVDRSIIDSLCTADLTIACNIHDLTGEGGFAFEVP